MSRSDASRYGGALKVALATTGIVALLVALAAIGLNKILSRRLDFDLDNDLTLVVNQTITRGTTTTKNGNFQTINSDGQVVFLWFETSGASPVALTSENPRLNGAVSVSMKGPSSVVLGKATYRFVAVPFQGGWILAAENQAAVHHLEIDVLLAELLLTPVVLFGVFLGVVVIAWRATAPIEAAHQRQLAFTADASHELRTPLAVIDAELQLVSEDPDEVRTTLQAIRRETGRLKGMVEGLLFLARADAAPSVPSSKRLDLTEVVMEGAARFKAVAELNNVGLRFEPHGVELALEAPREWIDQLVGVLMDNALRYTPSGGTVEVMTFVNGSEIGLSIADSGPGITPRKWRELTSRFHRASDRPGGAGLGLSIADVIVERTQGHWRVGRSDLGGASIAVTWHRATRSPSSRVGGDSKTESPGAQ